MMMISEQDVQKHAELSEVLDVVDQAFHSPNASMVSKVYIDSNNGDFRAMPAIVGDVAGVKWVSVFPENPSKNLPTVIGTILLNSAHTGELLAIVGGTLITKMRTAAAAAIATRKLSREDSKVAAFIGCGGQTKLHIDAILQVRDIEVLTLFDLNRRAAEELAVHYDNAVIADNVKHCVENADIVTSLTPSAKPIVSYGWLKNGVHVNAMGADAEGKREYDHEAYRMMDLWIVDEMEQARHSGETQHIGFSRDMFELAKCKTQEESQASPSLYNGRTGPSQKTLFDSTGLAIQDIAVATYVYEKLKHN